MRCGSGRGLTGSRTFCGAFRMQDDIQVCMLLGWVLFSDSHRMLLDIVEHVEGYGSIGQGGHEREKNAREVDMEGAAMASLV